MASGDKGFNTIPKFISPKVNIIAWLEFELTKYNVAVLYVSLYETGTSSDKDEQT